MLLDKVKDLRAKRTLEETIFGSTGREKNGSRWDLKKDT